MHEIEMCQSKGFVLPVVLLIIFVASLVVIHETDSVILSIKSNVAMSSYQRLYFSAQSALFQAERFYMGQRVKLLSKNVTLKIMQQHTDDCDNNHLVIRAVAQSARRRIILQSRDIFARVPVEKNCKRMPRFQRLWWQETGA